MVCQLRAARIQRQLDAAEDFGVVACAFDARLLSCGASKDLAAIGGCALQRLAEAGLRAQAAQVPRAADVTQEAWLLTRDGPLAALFEALALDGRLRNHHRPLGLKHRADAVRVLAGELGRGGSPELAWGARTAWRSELVRELAAAVLELRPSAARSGGSLEMQEAEPDAKTAMLLQSGSARAVLARLRAVRCSEEGCAANSGQLHASLVATLPRLNDMRLRVFAQVLHALCAPDASFLPSGEGAELAVLACDVVNATLSAGLQQMPCEDSDHFDDFRRSKRLTERQREALLRLLASPGKPPCLARDGPPPRAPRWDYWTKVPEWSPAEGEAGRQTWTGCGMAPLVRQSRMCSPPHAPGCPERGDDKALAELPCSADDETLAGLMREAQPSPPWPWLCWEGSDGVADHYAEMLGRSAARFRGRRHLPVCGPAEDRRRSASLAVARK